MGVKRTTLKRSLKRRKTIMGVNTGGNVANNSICLTVVQQNSQPFITVCLNVPSNYVFVISPGTRRDHIHREELPDPVVGFSLPITPRLLGLMRRS